MARVRQARQCRAHRSNGEPCRGWAILGGYVCRAHGGAAPSVRAKAFRRLETASIYREMAGADAMQQRDRYRWRIRQILTTAEVLGIDIEDVTLLQISVCHALHGVPSLEPPPRRSDRRFGRRKPRG